MEDLSSYEKGLLELPLPDIEKEAEYASAIEATARWLAALGASGILASAFRLPIDKEEMILIFSSYVALLLCVGIIHWFILEYRYCVKNYMAVLRAQVLQVARQPAQFREDLDELTFNQTFERVATAVYVDDVNQNIARYSFARMRIFGQGAKTLNLVAGGVFLGELFLTYRYLASSP